MYFSKQTKIIMLCMIATGFPLIGGWLLQLAYAITIPPVAWIVAGLVGTYSTYLVLELRKHIQDYQKQLTAIGQPQQQTPELTGIDVHRSLSQAAGSQTDSAQDILSVDAALQASTNNLTQTVVPKQDDHTQDFKSALFAELHQAETIGSHLKTRIGLDYFVTRCQTPIIVVSDKLNIMHLNQSALAFLAQQDTGLTNWHNQPLSTLTANVDVHVASLLKEAFNSCKKVRFLQEQPPSADWTVTPLRDGDTLTGYVIEIITPSKHELIKLEDSIQQATALRKKSEHEIAAFVNHLNEVQLYAQKPGKFKSLSEGTFEHPIIKRGINSVNKLTEQVVEAHHQLSQLQQRIQKHHELPSPQANQISVLTQAILRNLQELKRDYVTLAQQQQEHVRIVTDQKGITQSLDNHLQKGFGLTKTCRDKTLSGFETVTMILQNLHQFEQHLKLMLEILNKTTANIQKQALNEDIAKTLQAFMQSLTDQIKQAANLAQKNKLRLNILVPSYAGHHYQIGKLQSQWQNCHDLLETQSLSLAQWRQYNQKAEHTHQQLTERLQELINLSEKTLRKAYQTENSSILPHSTVEQFSEMVIDTNMVAAEAQDKGIAK